MMSRAFDYNEVKKLLDQRLLFSNLEEFEMELRIRKPEGQTSPKSLSWKAKLSCAEEEIDPKEAEEELSLIDEYLVEKGFPLTTEEVVTLEDSGSEVEMVTLDDTDLEVDIDDILDAGIIPEMDEELRLLSPGTMAYLEKRNTHGYQGVDVSDVWKRDDNFEQLEETTKTQPLIVCAENTPVSASLQKSPVETVQVQKTPATDERPSSPYNINKWMADKEKAKEEERLKRLERKLAASCPASTPKSARNLEVRVTRSRVTVVKVGRDEEENEDKRKLALDSVRKRIKFDENSEETFTSLSPPEVVSEVQEEEYRLRSTDSSSTNASNAKENHQDDIQEVTNENGKDDEDDITELKLTNENQKDDENDMKELTNENGKDDEEDDHNSENMDLLGILVSKGDKQIGNHRSSSQEILSSSSSPLRQKQITVPIRTPSKRKSAQIATLLLSSSKKSKTQPTAQESNAPKRKGQGRPRKI